MEEATQQQRDDDQRRYREWLDAVFEVVRGAIGGDDGQHGGDRWYGRGRFGYDMRSDLGVVDFTITDVEARRGTSVEPIEWRAFTPERVAELLLAAYRTLLVEP